MVLILLSYCILKIVIRENIVANFYKHYEKQEVYEMICIGESRYEKRKIVALKSLKTKEIRFLEEADFTHVFSNGTPRFTEVSTEELFKDLLTQKSVHDQLVQDAKKIEYSFNLGTYTLYESELTDAKRLADLLEVSLEDKKGKESKGVWKLMVSC